MISKDSDNLLRFVANVSGVDYRRIGEELGDGFVRLNIHEAERRQARHDIKNVEDIVVELLRNARDAKAQKVFLASHKTDSNERHFVMIDDGCGIPTRMHRRVFESRVTSKLDSAVFDEFGFHGRGMALYSIQCMVNKVDIIQSEPGKGSIFEISIDTGKIPEKSDQSTFPILVGDRYSSGLRGPHNALRVLTEFAMSCPQIEVYYGSPAQILATMYWPKMRPSPRADNVDSCEKYWRQISRIRDAAALARAGQALFRLPISERNAWRITSGEIGPLSDVVSILERQNNDRSQKAADKVSTETNAAKYIPEAELEGLSKAIQENFRGIEGKYFVKIQGKPKVTKSKNRIKVIIELGPTED